MITLTDPLQVITTIGSGSRALYDRLELASIAIDVINKNITGTCQLVASTGGVPPIPGTYNIPTSGAALMTISIPNALYFAEVPLTSTQQSTVQGWINTAQNNVEAGLIALGVAAGTQTPGI